ncbi:L,D-transpeptidase family protein [Clostridium sp. N3C]|uniref:L,D-transpeptidase family protein n=1 Tax=Clostridium sp. N3C TaxID=1776758 RepID=UPI001FA8D3DF|nr:L,D-transpeptidase family protein [Clostridium sp. N3C]
MGRFLFQEGRILCGRFIYNKEELESKINGLNCFNKSIQEPQNASFVYSKGSYEIMKEVYGNKVNKNKLIEAVKYSLQHGERILNLEEKFCYENPKYTSTSEKVIKTRALLNKCVSTKITYLFGDEKEVLDGDIISKWLIIDENLKVKLNEIEVMKYVKFLSEKYDTMGAKRSFKTSLGKVVEVDGGIYGWKINYGDESKAILKSIQQGEVIEREPIYFQRAARKGPNDIGDTYVEVNITRQRLWFYKNGRIIAQGPVVTGNPNRGNATVVGTYMLNYKQKDTTLKGPGYEAKVTYWMPFYGNIGIHDASWRHAFGGNIYKSNGSHGCVNVSLNLAKTIFENIEKSTPIICYEE